MKKLIIKKEFEGLRITRNDIRVGKITFDANTVDPQHYENYKNLGFDLFDEVEEEIEIEVIVPDNIEEQKTSPEPKKRRAPRKKKVINNYV